MPLSRFQAAVLLALTGIVVAIPNVSASAHVVEPSRQSAAPPAGGDSEPRPRACGRPGAELQLTEDDARRQRKFRRADCDLTGVTVRVKAAAALVPPPGTGVSAFASTGRGGSEISVLTDAEGTVTVGAGGYTGNVTTPAGPYNCGGNAFTTFQDAHRHLYRSYYINASSYPWSITREQWIADIRSAADTWRLGRNTCNLPQNTPEGIQLTYSGQTSRFANISDGGACQTPDGYGVVSGGNLPGSTETGGTYGYACIWFNAFKLPGDPHDIIEGDIKLDGYDVRWWAAGYNCYDELHLPSAASHEFGHFVGLNHVSEADHGSLVMSEMLNRCTFNEWLGEGDYRGRDWLY